MTLEENNLRLSNDEFYINKGKKKKPSIDNDKGNTEEGKTK